MTARTGHSHFEATVLEVLVPGAAAPQVVVITEEVVTYLEAVEQGPAGAPGISPQGPDLNATHVQASAAAVWAVTHGLGKRPSVTVVDSAGDPVEGLVAYTNANSLTITFSAALSGSAFLN